MENYLVTVVPHLPRRASLACSRLAMTALRPVPASTNSMAAFTLGRVVIGPKSPVVAYGLSSAVVTLSKECSSGVPALTVSLS